MVKTLTRLLISQRKTEKVLATLSHIKYVDMSKKTILDVGVQFFRAMSKKRKMDKYQRNVSKMVPFAPCNTF